MVKMTFDQFDAEVNRIQQMDVHFGDAGDPWYPTAQQLEERANSGEQEDILFLIWVAYSGTEISEKQQNIAKYAESLLRREDVLWLGDENETT